MEELRIAFRNLSHQKTRTLLTLLGVIVGISAVVSLISLGDGLNSSISEQLEQLGPNRILVIPRNTFSPGPSGSGITLTEKDLEAIEKINDVDIAIPILSKSLPIKFNEESRITTVSGFPAKDSERFFSDVQSFELAQGRFMKDGERGVAVIGDRLAHDMFDKDVKIKSNLEISGKKFEVIGIMKPVGNQQDDNAIMTSLEGLREITGDKDEISVIMVKVREDPKGTATKIEDKLEDLHNKDKLFTAMTSEQLLEQVGSIFGIISVILIGIAGISLIVASFGIINTMLMAVLERTQEIGVMKALGATNHRILVMFVTESAIVGFIGGVFGTIIGYSLSLGMSQIATTTLGITLKIKIDPMLIVSVLLFSTIVGVIAGTYPAYRAAKLDPIESLRHE